MIANIVKPKSIAILIIMVSVLLGLMPHAAFAECRKLGVPIMGVEGVCDDASPNIEDRNIEGEEVTAAVAENMIFAYLMIVMRFLSVGVGLVITLMVVVSGVQYIGSAGNPQKIEAAKTKLRHALEALLLFIFLSAIINWLIPGGLL